MKRFDPMPSRRTFIIKTFAAFAAAAVTPAGPWRARVLADAEPVNTPDGGVLRLRLADFPALAEDFGSVRLGTSPIQGHRPQGLFYPIVVNRAPGGRFHALSAECTHEGCVVPTLNPQRVSVCPCHGSQFDVAGAVLEGPAGFPLLSYCASMEGSDVLRIEVPGLGLSLTGQSVLVNARQRFKLEFPAFAQLLYVVHFRPDFSQPWARVPFATTPDGPMSRTVLPGQDDLATVFVETSTDAGFFSVGILAQEA